MFVYKVHPRTLHGSQLATTLYRSVQSQVCIIKVSLGVWEKQIPALKCVLSVPKNNLKSTKHITDKH